VKGGGKKRTIERDVQGKRKSIRIKETLRGNGIMEERDRSSDLSERKSKSQESGKKEECSKL